MKIGWKFLLWNIYETIILCSLVFLAILGILRTHELNSESWQINKEFCEPVGYWGISWDCDADAYNKAYQPKSRYTNYNLTLNIS
jgi:hypothetical protein